MLNNFIYAKEKSLFEEALSNGEVLDEAIVFIEDTKEIWNHGTYFDGNAVDLSDVEKSIQDILNNIPTKVSQLENDVNYAQDYVMPENGVYIYDIDGNFTLPNDWITADNSKAVGVAILTDDCRFVVAKEDISTSGIRWGGYGTDVPGVLTTTDSSVAATDFDGVNNTSKIIAAIGNTNDGYRDGTAAGDCAAYTFPNGKTGYLGAAGEWQVARQNKDALNSALTLIGGTTMTESAYWTSTEYSSSNAWYQWFDSNSNLSRSGKIYNVCVRAFLALEVKPLKERVSDLESNKADKTEIPIITSRIESLESSVSDLEEKINELSSTNGSSEANVKAINTGDVVDEVEVNYATTEYVNSVLGDINSILESIINGESTSTPALIDNYLNFMSKMIDDTSSYYFMLEYPAESNLIINATHTVPNIVDGTFQGFKEVIEEYHIDKGNMTINETISGYTEFTNISITPEYDNVYRYVYNA